MVIPLLLSVSLGLFANINWPWDVEPTPPVLGTDIVAAINVPQPILTRSTCRERVQVGTTSYSTPSLENTQTNIGYRNNKFGIYVYDRLDLIERGGDLVNSQGGKWGYVLIPYNVKDYDYDKWRAIFADLRERELIPILQLWDVDPADYEEATREAAQFLSTFDWPIKPRYVSVYNEPNDEKFWQGTVDPANYAQVLAYTITTFKETNPNFFMLNGAFNATAPNGGGYIDQVNFMLQMNVAVPGIFARLDGWASHSYPQPAYRGHPTDSGRQSIRAYEWELSVLRDYFGVYNLPVFITETGWPHAEAKKDDYSYFDQETVALFIKQAFEEVWLPDERVVAVTPFTIRYDPPHDNFSWIKPNDDGVYPQFDTIQQMTKVAGDPPQLTKTTLPLFPCQF